MSFLNIEKAAHTMQRPLHYSSDGPEWIENYMTYKNEPEFQAWLCSRKESVEKILTYRYMDICVTDLGNNRTRSIDESFKYFVDTFVENPANLPVIESSAGLKLQIQTHIAYWFTSTARKATDVPISDEGFAHTWKLHVASGGGSGVVDVDTLKLPLFVEPKKPSKQCNFKCEKTQRELCEGVIRQYGLNFEYNPYEETFVWIVFY